MLVESGLWSLLFILLSKMSSIIIKKCTTQQNALLISDQKLHQRDSKYSKNADHPKSAHGNLIKNHNRETEQTTARGIVTRKKKRTNLVCLHRKICNGNGTDRARIFGSSLQLFRLTILEKKLLPKEETVGLCPHLEQKVYVVFRRELSLLESRGTVKICVQRLPCISFSKGDVNETISWPASRMLMHHVIHTVINGARPVLWSYITL